MISLAQVFKEVHIMIFSLNLKTYDERLVVDIALIDNQFQPFLSQKNRFHKLTKVEIKTKNDVNI